MKNAKLTKRIACFTMSSLPLAIPIGCSQAEEFRSVASSQIQAGLTSIATGLIDGIFAVIKPDATSETDQ